ncbi:hypothetical protein WA026_020751 [Henosepilachna vigintioctopunctata]|uniref:Uncharacterized protein n=1 Tax=Henosepilachna vigintioctopunctata TaxID=420089 RepID=A0AAW1UBW1_9CUCU
MASILVVFCLIVYVLSDDTCKRPEDLEAKKSHCYKNHVDILDRIHETSQSLLNFAKKTLGREVIEDEKVPEKCEYYQCVLQELHLLNSNKIPIYEVIKTWIEENVIFSSGTELLKRLTLCNESLTNSTVSNLRFRGDLTTEEYRNEEESDSIRKCDLDAEFFRCLSLQNGVRY